VAQAGDLGLEPEPARAAPEELVLRVHDASYLSALEGAQAAGGGYLDINTYITKGSMQAARTASGAVVEGVARVLSGEARHAFAVVRPPGHHAERALPFGFCLINNVAVGVFAARAQGVQRIAIIDFDVHHGNGTQDIFYEDPDVLYCSTHQYGPWRQLTFFPGTGRANERGAGPALGTTVNIPLPAGTGDAVFLDAYKTEIAPVIERFEPELLLVSAGYDAHQGDPLAGLEITTEGYRQLATMINAWADRHCRGRSVWALEGGYNLEAMSTCVVDCLRTLQVEERC